MHPKSGLFLITTVFFFTSKTLLAQPFPENCTNQLDDDLDGYIDCYDADCQCFSQNDCTVAPPENNFSARLAWQSASDEVSIDAVPLVANLDPQRGPVPEIIVATVTASTSAPGKEILIFRGDGSDRNAPARLPVPEGFDPYPMTHPAVGDLDRDGRAELVLVTADGFVRVFRDFDPQANPPMQNWLVSDLPAGDANFRPALADFDADGQPEIFCGNEVFQLDLSDPMTPFLKKIKAPPGPVGQAVYANYAQRATATAAADLLDRADCGGDPDCDGLEIAAGPAIFSVDLDPTDGDPAEIKIQKNLNHLAAAANWEDGYTAVADLDLDGRPDVVVSGRQNGTTPGVYAWNKNGLLRFFPYQNQSPSLAIFSGSLPCIANVFDDRTAGAAQDFPEIIVCNSSRLNCLNLHAADANPLQPWWWSLPTTDISGMTGSTVFDFNADGLLEIVYRDQDNLRILYGGPAPYPQGVDNQRNWFKFETGSGTFDEYPVVADLDADGQSEIAVTGYLTAGLNFPPGNYRGRLRVFESAATPWAPARRVWNQFNYHVTNVADDLSIPAVQQAHWLEFPAPGSGLRPFNTYLAQQPFFDKNFQPAYPVPDAEASVDSVFCKNGGIEVMLRVCNEGSAVLPAGTPVVVYASDPTLGPSAIFDASQVLERSVACDSCQVFILKLKMPATGQTLAGIVNDDGSLPQPLDLAADFPSTDLPECRFENNIFQIKFDYQPPVLDLGDDRKICPGSTTTLAPGAGFSNFQWQDGSVDSTFSTTSAGTFWLAALDHCGVQHLDSVEVRLAPSLSVSLLAGQPACFGDSTGTLSAAVSGGTQPFHFFWKNSPSTDPALSGLTPGDFSVIVSDSIGCTAKASGSIVWPAPLSLFFSGKNPTCHGGSDGSATLTVNGGTAPHLAAWPDGKTAATRNDLPAGIFEIKITDARGCLLRDTLTLANPPAVVLLDTLQKPVSCIGVPDGGLTVVAGGGKPPYRYAWSNNQTAPAIENLLAGTYRLTVTDASDCTFAAVLELPQPQPFFAGATLAHDTCEAATGAVNFSALGGTPPYFFEWSSGAKTQSINKLSAGKYAVTATDSRGCSLTMEQEILAYGKIPRLEFEAEIITCRDSLASVRVASAQPGTAYVWRRPDGQQFFGEKIETPLPGSHLVEALTEEGCAAQASAEVKIDTLRPLAEVTEKFIFVPCGITSALLDGSPSSAGPDIRARWQFFENQQLTWDTLAAVAQAGAPGWFFLAVENTRNGCADADSVFVEFATPVGAGFELKNASCFGFFDGSVAIEKVHGGLPPYFYSIENQSFTLENRFEKLRAGAYPIFIRDSVGCTWETVVEVGQPDSIFVNLTASPTVVEPGEAVSLLAELLPSDSQAQVLRWLPGGLFESPDSVFQEIFPQETTVFQVEMVDKNGCTASAMLSVRVLQLGIFAPNVFQPGSNRNAVFTIFAGADVAEVAFLQVFDRWGNLVFENKNFTPNDPTEGWDGRFRGKKAAPGVYVFSAEVIFWDGRRQRVSGSLTLLE